MNVSSTAERLQRNYRATTHTWTRAKRKNNAVTKAREEYEDRPAVPLPETVEVHRSSGRGCVHHSLRAALGGFLIARRRCPRF